MKKTIIGAVIIIAVLVAGYFIFIYQPEPTLESIAENKQLSDVKAIENMGKLLFPSAKSIDVNNKEGVNIKIVYAGRDKATVQTFNGQNSDDAAKIDKAIHVTMMLIKVRRLIKYGSLRGLTNIEVDMLTALLDESGNKVIVRIFSVNIPKDRFPEISQLKVNRDFLSSSDKMLTEIGVVTFNGFDKVIYTK